MQLDASKTTLSHITRLSQNIQEGGGGEIFSLTVCLKA